MRSSYHESRPRRRSISRCSVLSVSTAAHGPRRETPIYARERVANLWRIDPVARTLEVFRLEDERWVLLGTWRDDTKVRVEPFAELELDFAVPWAK